MSSSHKYIKDYPRPQLVRENWENLNGEWDFRFDDAWEGESGKWYDRLEADRKITVPSRLRRKQAALRTNHSIPAYGMSGWLPYLPRKQVNVSCFIFKRSITRRPCGSTDTKSARMREDTPPFPSTLPKRLRPAGRTGLPFEPWTATAVPNRAASAVDEGQLRLLVRADDGDMADGMDGVRESDSYQPGKNNAGAGTRVGKLLLRTGQRWAGLRRIDPADHHPV